MGVTLRVIVMRMIAVVVMLDAVVILAAAVTVVDVIVFVIMAMAKPTVMMMVPLRAMTMSEPEPQQAAPEHVEPDRSNREAGCDAQPWIKMVRHDVLRRVQRDQAERIDARRMRDG